MCLFAMNCKINNDNLCVGVPTIHLADRRFMFNKTTLHPPPRSARLHKFLFILLFILKFMQWDGAIRFVECPLEVSLLNCTACIYIEETVYLFFFSYFSAKRSFRG